MSSISVIDSGTSVELCTSIELADFLSKRNIPVHTYGEWITKSVELLFWEIYKRESELQVVDGVVQRILRVLNIDVFSPNEDRVLKEYAQVKFDGNVRRRWPDELWATVSEKLEIGEDEFQWAIRAIKEELTRIAGSSEAKKVLGYLQENNDIAFIPENQQAIVRAVQENWQFGTFLTEAQIWSLRLVEETPDRRMTKTYPWILNITRVHRGKVILEPQQVDEAYYEVQTKKEKISLFTWRTQ